MKYYWTNNAISIFEDIYHISFEWGRGNSKGLKHTSVLCQVWGMADDDELDLIDFGIAELHPNDSFDLRIGMMKSFEKAIQLFDRQNRIYLWDWFNVERPDQNAHSHEHDESFTECFEVRL